MMNDSESRPLFLPGLVLIMMQTNASLRHSSTVFSFLVQTNLTPGTILYNWLYPSALSPKSTAMSLGLCIFRACGQSEWVCREFFFCLPFLFLVFCQSLSKMVFNPENQPKDLTCHYTIQSSLLAIIRILSTHSHMILSWWIIAYFASFQIEFWLQKQTKSFLTRLPHCFITGFWPSEFALYVCPLCENKLYWLVSQ